MFPHKSAAKACRAGQDGVSVQVNGFSHETIKLTSPPDQPSLDAIDNYAGLDKNVNQETHPISRPLAENGTKKLNISRVSQLKHRLTDAAEALLVALNTYHRQQARRESAPNSSPRELLSEFGQRGKTDTSLTGHDISHGRLQRKIHQEIKKNYSEETKTGFLPGPRLLGLLNLETLERELARSDSFLEKRHEILSHLRFQFPSGETRAKAIRVQAQKILGDSKQHLVPTVLTEPMKVTSNQEESASKKSYLKIMAILIMIERPARIKLFMDADVCDADLPLKLVKQHESGSSTPWELRRTDAGQVPLKCFEGWSYSTIKQFEESQWSFLAPVLSPAERKNVPHYRFSPKTILPFKASKKSDILEGGFGHVRKVEIHAGHRAFTNAEAASSFFAVKTLKDSRNEDVFKREVATLSRLSGDTHPHLISLLGTYEKDGLYNLIFPWAESDLLRYWKGKRNLKPNESLLWIAEQCQGIADGLSYIHRLETTSGKSLLHPNSFSQLTQEMEETGNVIQENATTPAFCLFGLHGDIKPENILWFPHSNHPTHKERGLLKITDFGFAEFSRKEKVDKNRRGFVAYSPTYYPPEAKLESDFVSSSYDIWSLGCVYLEFIAWWLGGWRLIFEFYNRRLQPDPTSAEWKGIRYKSDIFFSLVRNDRTGKLDAYIKDSVSKFIEHLRSHPRSNVFIGQFLDLIKDHMLVVEEPANGGTGPHRKSSANIARELEAMRIDQRWVNSAMSQQSTMLPEKK
ncbi:hypothetical protein F4801DRAFT_568380 [Xylaria longipes]|nr:hypothetical protein F4801DRAFT_568380 [Xylaria longipes]